VETENVDARIVYATDAQSSSKIKVVAKTPEKSHSPVFVRSPQSRARRILTLHEHSRILFPALNRALFSGNTVSLPRIHDTNQRIYIDRLSHGA
jgi:hypothetical protein